MKRRSFLGALAAVFAAPKLLEATEKPAPKLELYTPPAFCPPDEKAVTICPNCGRFRTKEIVMALAPEAGVAALSESDYLPTYSLAYIEGCPRCAEEMRDARL